MNMQIHCSLFFYVTQGIYLFIIVSGTVQMLLANIRKIFGHEMTNIVLSK